MIAEEQKQHVLAAGMSVRTREGAYAPAIAPGRRSEAFAGADSLE